VQISPSPEAAIFSMMGSYIPSKAKSAGIRIEGIRVFGLVAWSTEADL
jgi:hypothetical protein